ncbi:tRNA lysidine(34) synthetase TilS [Roseiconus nitratireducens]|uniref:tRNA(Ile)-lysidine synthase n=1 Tax=Roseiconus nitratireducens TaxID=2605748 RepID=A0A5M6DCQ4_9BACT|nr:tRNA lysidine(34) synthetase TilS [Roseiconus nitratireducens]KAA5545348.1 tRNA lysidine(34) synthetase TilS [Roseiconus nitratireducens]
MNKSPAWSETLRAIEAAWPVDRYRDVGVVVACSGGADSVALVRGLGERIADSATRLGEPQGVLVVAHFNHRLRGAESEADVSFVRQLANDLGLRFESEAGTGEQEDEQSARDDRRQFLGDVARRHGARYVAMGHSLDDNVETVLHRLLRGTGPAGLTGISPFRSLSHRPEDRDLVVARPLLAVRRQQIRQALHQLGQDWREDRTNTSTRYRRNWVRHELIPRLQTEFPDAVEAIDRAISGQRQWAEAMESRVQSWIESNVISQQPLRIQRLDRSVSAASGDSASATSDQAIVVESLRRCWYQRGWPLQPFGQRQWNSVFQILCGEGPATITLPGAIEVRRDQQAVCFLRRQARSTTLRPT